MASEEKEVKVQIEKVCPQQGDVLVVHFDDTMTVDDVKRLRSGIEELVQKIRVHALVIPKSIGVSTLSRDVLESLIADKKMEEGKPCSSTHKKSRK